MAKVKDEKQRQIEFYESYIKVVDSSLTLDDIFGDSTDGVLNGNLLEFKNNINNLNAVLFQAIKYCSSLRIKGKSVPANILLISAKDEIAYLYHSKDYLKDIEKVYSGPASKNVEGYVADDYIQKLEYGKKQKDEADLIKLLREKNYTKINIDENCIVGWATRFYREYPSARKADFIGDLTGEYKIEGEIRKPDKFKQFINPYKGKNNVKFQYLMDQLNDFLQKKDLGAFFTSPLYCNKSVELLREAIKRVPKGNDYVIIDRCAGTGNLELSLSEEELSHTIVATIEYYEYKVLVELLGDKVLHIIPPTEKPDTFNMGLVRGSDALSKDFIDNEIIKQYIDNPKCTIILYENPPYIEASSVEHQKKKAGKQSSQDWKTSYVASEMKKEVKGTALNDKGNAFIWSAFKYYLRQPTDSYVVYSPVKYWKAQHLIDKKFIKGYAFNRRGFHTEIDACVMVALWMNKDAHNEELSLSAFDIDEKKGKIIPCGKLPVYKIHSLFSDKYYDKRKFKDDKECNLICDGKGDLLNHPVKVRVKPIDNKNMIGYLIVQSSGFDNPDLNCSFVRGAKYNGNGFYLRSDNYLEKLPMFCAGRYIAYNRQWTERARIMKSGDGDKEFSKAVKQSTTKKWLLKCLLFTCLDTQNHLKTIKCGSKIYKNELCLDNTNGTTLALKELKKMSTTKNEKELLDIWSKVLKCAKKTKKYNKNYSYGVYQIFDELNTHHKNKDGDIIYDYPELNGLLTSLKKKVIDYYNKDVVPNLFKYEFLK